MAFKKFRILDSIWIFSGVIALLLPFQLPAQPASEVRPAFPVAWTSYQKVISFEKDFADMKAHGIGMVDITERANLVREAGLEPVDALMIGGVSLGKAIDRHLFPFRAQTGPDLNEWLRNAHGMASVKMARHNFDFFNRVESESVFDLGAPGAVQKITFRNSAWEMDYHSSVPDDRPDALDAAFRFRVVKGTSPQTSVSIEFTFNRWSAGNFVLMPAAVYNGNRYESRRIRYSPKLLDPRDIGPDQPMIISDVPRLNISDGPSRIQDRSGAMSVPAIGFQSVVTKTAFWVLTHQSTRLGDTGMSIEESRDRSTAVISLTVPVVRVDHQYFITDNQAASKDKAPDFKEGDEFTLRFRLYHFPSSEIQGLYDRFAGIRKDLPEETPLKPFIPFSSCFSVQEKKFNEQNWVEEQGYYSVGMRENFLQDWQIGWTGGMITTYPLLFAGNQQSRANVIRNFDWLFPNGISPSGFFWDSGEKGTRWYGGDIRKPHTANWHLVRKSGDGLYYIIRQFLLMEKDNIIVRPEWKEGTRVVADAFVKLWDEWHQFGNFIDSRTGDVVVGGSTSGAIVPAALVLASRYFNEQQYLKVAEASAEYYYQRFVKKGITCGGPGDAMQNPDSESSYALLESFMQLFETTLDKKWLERAEEARKPLGENVLRGGRIIHLQPGKSCELVFRK